MFINIYYIVIQISLLID